MATIKFDPSTLSTQALEFLAIVKQRHPGCMFDNTIVIGERSDDLSMRISCNSAITWRERCKKFGYTSGNMRIGDIEKFSPAGMAPIPTDEYLDREDKRIAEFYGELPSAPGKHQTTYTGRNLRRVAGKSGNEIIEFVAADFFKFLREGDLQ